MFVSGATNFNIPESIWAEVISVLLVIAKLFNLKLVILAPLKVIELKVAPFTLLNALVKSDKTKV